jgi:hypothetical protein
LAICENYCWFSSLNIALLALRAYLAPLRPRMPLFFSLMKRTKNQVIRDASCRTGLMRCKVDKTSGPLLLPPVAALGHRFRQNYQCPCRRTTRLVLSPFARSCRMTVLFQNQYLVVLNNKKKRKGLSGRAAGSFALRDGSDRPDLIFWLLLDQAKRRSPLERLKKTNSSEKSNSLPAAIERDDAGNLCQRCSEAEIHKSIYN